MKLTTHGLVAFGLVLVGGIGGALGAEALGADGLGEMILAFAAGLLVPVSPWGAKTS